MITGCISVLRWCTATATTRKNRSWHVRVCQGEGGGGGEEGRQFFFCWSFVLRVFRQLYGARGERRVGAKSETRRCSSLAWHRVAPRSFAQHRLASPSIAPRASPSVSTLDSRPRNVYRQRCLVPHPPLPSPQHDPSEGNARTWLPTRLNVFCGPQSSPLPPSFASH